MMKSISNLILAVAVFLLPGVATAQLKVASLHPLVADLARQVGGETVEVVDLFPPGGDPHHFAPTLRQLSDTADARLILASGKGMETYLDGVRDSLAEGQEIYEVGRKVPSITVEPGELFYCCPAHSNGALDPHWWHSIPNMSRAARYLGEEFGRVDPANAGAYKARAKVYRDTLDDLEDWAKAELRKVPRGGRVLTTAHAAFAYFCKDFGFKQVTLQGLTGDGEPTPQYLATAHEIIVKDRVRAAFPEAGANPKVLEALVADTGIAMGKPLVADGNGTGEQENYIGMMRHNIGAIVEALGEE